MQRHYRFNIALNDEHFFATADHSCTDEDKAKAVYRVLKKKFPASEGYKLTCTLWAEVGEFVDLNKFE